MASSSIIKRYFWIVFITLLAACSPGATTPITPTEVDVNAVSTQAAATVIAQMTQMAAPTPTRTPAPTPTSLPSFTLEGLRMAYIIKGNLYVQDSGGQPVQVTHSGQDRSPIFSDDGQKIVFYRGPLPEKNNVYVINADGSGEQALLTNSLLTALGLGYGEETEPFPRDFVPGTHQLLFDTHELDPLNGKLRNTEYSTASPPNNDLLLVNTDTGKIRQLQARGQGSDFQFSPDGKLWRWRANHIDVIDLDGTVVRRNLAAIPPALLNMPITQWAQDLSKIYIMPLDPAAGAQENSGLVEPRSLWQYPTDGREAVEIHLSPPLMGYMFSISPDGNWVVYTFTDPAQRTKETATPGIYLGNLRNGTTQLIDKAGLYGLPFYYSWSPDGTYFIFDDEQDRMYMGNIDGKITPLVGRGFRTWIDASRYLYDSLAMGEIGKESKMVIEFPTDTYKNLQSLTFVFVKPK